MVLLRPSPAGHRIRHLYRLCSAQLEKMSARLRDDLVAAVPLKCILVNCKDMQSPPT